MRILLVYTSVGDGHRKSAESIAEAFREIDKENLDIRLIDILNYTSRFFNCLYTKIYMYIIRHFPYLWGFFYYIGHNDWLYFWITRIRRMFNALNTRRFVELLKREQPDFVVSTHFFPGEIVSGLKRRGVFGGKLITVITDFSLHSFWVTRDVDVFIVANENVKRDLVKEGVDEKRIRVMGIPIGLAFRRAGNGNCSAGVTSSD